MVRIGTAIFGERVRDNETMLIIERIWFLTRPSRSSSSPSSC
jgi:hypothetical protein